MFKKRKKLKQAADTGELDFKIGKLAFDSSEDVRVAVASNTSVPHHALEVLAKDEKENVQLAVAQNTWKMTPKIHKALSQSHFPTILEALQKIYPEGAPKTINFGPKRA